MVEISKAQVYWKALDDAVSASSDKPAWIYQGVPISYKQVDEVSDRVASGLLAMGFQKGDRLGIIALNQPEWLYTYHAAAKIGATITGLNVRYREMELDYILNQSETRAVISLPEAGDMNYVEFFQGFRDKVPSVKDYIFLGGEGFPGSRSYEDLLNTPVDKDALDQAKAQVQPDDLLMIIYTSGTTGKPKGAAVTHKSQLASARAQAEHTKIDPDDVFPLALPFNHVGGITCGATASLLGRGTCVLIPMFDPGYVIDVFKEYKCTIVPGVPTMHALLMLNEKFATWEDKDKVKLVFTGGSNSEPGLLTALMEHFPNANIMNLYGLSESSGGIVMSPWDSDFDHTVRCIGKTTGDFQVKVVDVNTKEDLPAGETGELHFKGDAIAAGYFRMPEETAECFDADGWLHTGDLGYLDPDGYITLMGRIKEMWVQGGFNVYPAEIENLLTKHPKVFMAAGIGISDPVLGEIGRYYIVPQPGTEPTVEEIKEYCKEHLADYKVPKQIVFKDQLPLTPVGKIMKSVLKSQYVETGE